VVKGIGGKGDAMTCYEPTLDELLSDPLTGLVMAADKVDRVQLQAMLLSAAATIEGRSVPGRGALSRFIGAAARWSNSSNSRASGNRSFCGVC
jgi:hypothetical protein